MWQDVCSLILGWIRLRFIKARVGLQGGQPGGGSTAGASTDWLWNLFHDGLDKTVMSLCRYILFTGRAFAVPAFVSLEGLEALAQRLAVGATLVGTADGCLGNGRYTPRTGMSLVVQEAVGAEKEALAVST